MRTSGGHRLHVTPRQSGVVERQLDGVADHLANRLLRKFPEPMQADSENSYVCHFSPPDDAAVSAHVRTDRPSESTYNVMLVRPTGSPVRSRSRDCGAIIPSTL